MTAAAEAGTARDLGSGGQLIEVELPRGVAPPAVEDVRVTSRRRDAAGGIEVELVVPPSPGQGRRWGIVVAWERDAKPLSTDDLEIRVRGVRVMQTRPDSDYAEPLGSQDDATGADRHVDYRARDFDAVKTSMLRMIVDAVGPSVDLNPVGETTALVEVLAYLADNISYAQDAIATEAYLSTARRRISVTRHAALMDYWVHPGSNARTWIRIDIAGGDAVELPKGTPLLTSVPKLPTHLTTATDLERAVADGALVFETMTDVLLEPDVPPFEIDRNTHPDGVLPPRATAVTCSGHHPALEEGTLAVVETLSEPAHSHVVRLTSVARVREEHDVTTVEWGPADALPDHPAWRRPVRLRVCNLVLADHGRTRPRPDDDPPWEALPQPTTDHPYWPALPYRDVSFTRPLPSGLRGIGATEALATHAEPLGDVTLEERSPSGTYRWRVRRSLLDSGPGARDVVVEADNDGTARLRFGDGVNGMRPHPDAAMYVRMRVGGGPAGNVRSGAIAHVVAPGLDATITNVSNVDHARGGSSPERLSSVRTYAPRAFRINRRAVTKDDYENVTRSVPGVLDVDVELTSSGAGPLVVVRVHSGWPSSKTVMAAVETKLARRRVLGVALEVAPARPRPVEIDLDVWVGEGWEANAVQPALDRTIRSQLAAPSRFGFHTNLHRSDVLVPLAAVPGVADVQITRFRIAGAERDQDELHPGRGQILEVGDFAGSPATGVVSYRLRGGDR